MRIRAILPDGFGKASGRFAIMPVCNLGRHNFARHNIGRHNLDNQACMPANSARPLINARPLNEAKQFFVQGVMGAEALTHLLQ